MTLAESTQVMTDAPTGRCEICGHATHSKYGVCRTNPDCAREANRRSALEHYVARPAGELVPCVVCGRKTTSRHRVCTRTAQCRSRRQRMEREAQEAQHGRSRRVVPFSDERIAELREVTLRYVAAARVATDPTLGEAALEAAMADWSDAEADLLRFGTNAWEPMRAARKVHNDTLLTAALVYAASASQWYAHDGDLEWRDPKLQARMRSMHEMMMDQANHTQEVCGD